MRRTAGRTGAEQDGVLAGGCTPDASGWAVRTSCLAKRYGERIAIEGLDLSIAAGQVYGLLGPNGAGKTTTLRILLGLVAPDAGSAHLFGADIRTGPASRSGVAGFVEEPGFYPYLTGRQHLGFLRAFDVPSAPTATVDQTLALVGLTSRADDRVGGYSQGMRQRLALAGCLLRRPRLLILDEPTNGLDPAGIVEMRALIRRLRADGMTVLYSSHLLGEVEQVCDRVAILARGRVVFEGSLPELRARAGGARYRLVSSNPAAAQQFARAGPGLTDVELSGSGHVLFVADGEAAVQALVFALAAARIGVNEIIHERASLEGLFLQLSGDGPDGGAPP